MKMPVFKLAKELNLSNKQTIELLNKCGVNVTTHINQISEQDANMVRNQVNSASSDTVEKITNKRLVECYTCIKTENGHMVYKVLIDPVAEKEKLIPMLPEYAKYRSKVVPQMQILIERSFYHDKED